MISAITADRSNSANKAITFLELLIVIAIIGILSVSIIPAFRNTVSNFALEGFAKDIYFLCRYLQASAVTNSKIYCLNIDTLEGKFWATYQVGDEYRGIGGRFGKIYLAPANTSISVTFPEPLDIPKIYFYPDGAADEAVINFENNHNHKVTLATQGESGGIKIQ